MYTILWYFIIYAFLGWCCEVAFAAFVHGKFVNRGFLCGPFCPIYGFGICIVYLLLMPIRKTWLLLFICSVILTSLLEFATGFALDKIFRQRWWDYTGNRFNLCGYVCLSASLAWGVGCLFVVKVLFALTDKFIAFMPNVLGIVLLSVFLAILAADTVVTIFSMARLAKYIKQLDELKSVLRESSELIGKKVASGTIKAKDNYERVTANGTPVGDFIDKSKAAAEDLSEKTDTFIDTFAVKKKLLEYELSDISSEIMQEYSEKKRELVSTYHAKRKDYQKLLSKVSKKYSRLLRAFPNISFNDFPEQTKALKKILRKKK